MQGLRNDLNRGLHVGNGKFDRMLGIGSMQEIADMIRVRFNMDGLDPSGQKVGLLDRHHIMQHMVDPLINEWRSRFQLPVHEAVIVTEMMEKYVPKDKDGSTTTRDRVRREFEVCISLTWSLFTFKMIDFLIFYMCYTGLLHTAGRVAAYFC